MKGQFRNAAMLALALGISAPAHTVWAEQFLKIDGLEDASPGLALTRIPGDTFSTMQLRNFRAAGIGTLGDLMAADAAVVGRILGTRPEQARMMQRHLREAVSKR